MVSFIDLFAGIGGTRLAFEQAGGRCVFSSELDKFARQTYEANHGEHPHGDITTIPTDDIPAHDILVAGFPCQPFSIAGVSKKNSLGREHGFADEKRGNLFFEIERIVRAKKPKAFLLENVKHLQRHDKGNTFRVITNTLLDAGYRLFYQIRDAQYYVPQHRERIFIVGLREDLFADVDFAFPPLPEQTEDIRIANILDSEVDGKYTLSDKLWDYLQRYKEKHQKRGNGFGYGLIDPTTDAITRTLSARYYKDGSEILIKQGAGNPRRLTPRECARLMGFPDHFDIPVSDTQAYKQFGNSVVVPVVADIAQVLVDVIENDYEADQLGSPTRELEPQPYQLALF